MAYEFQYTISMRLGSFKCFFSQQSFFFRDEKIVSIWCNYVAGVSHVNFLDNMTIFWNKHASVKDWNWLLKMEINALTILQAWAKRSKARKLNVGQTENTEKSAYSSMVTVQLSDFNALLSFVVINKILKHIPKTNPS